jgi:hypothetical protein
MNKQHLPLQEIFKYLGSHLVHHRSHQKEMTTNVQKYKIIYFSNQSNVYNFCHFHFLTCEPA